MGILDHVNLHLVDTVDKAMEFKRWLGQTREVLGVDTETGGFNFHQHRLRLVQFGDMDTGWAIPWERWGGVALEALNAYDGELVLHNAPFDAQFLIHHAKRDLRAWRWDRTNDTMTQAHLLDPARPKGLKPLGAMHIDNKAAAAQNMLDEAMSDNKWTWDTVPVEFPLYWIYAAMDPVLTSHLHHKFRPAVAASYEGVYQLELGTLRVLTNMMLRGARVDLAYSHQMKHKMGDWMETARQWCYDTYGVRNATSNAQIIKRLEDDGVTFTKRTDGGSISLDKEVLESLADHPLADTVLAIRKAQKVVSTYFDSFIELADDRGYLHATIWSLAAKTSRMSITKPALQTLPRKDPLVRKAFVPTDENHAILTCDFDQVEARLFTDFSADPGLIEAFTSGDDFFWVMAEEVYARKLNRKRDKEVRQVIKNSWYSRLYGAGLEKQALTAGVPYEVMQGVREGMDRRFPGVQRYIDMVDSQGQSRQIIEGLTYVMTPWGRRLLVDYDKSYTLVNYRIQGHAAELFKLKLLQLDAVGLGPYMVLPVHDEVVLDVPKADAEELRVLVAQTMSDATSYAVPITASADVMTKSWGEKYERDG